MKVLSILMLTLVLSLAQPPSSLAADDQQARERSAKDAVARLEKELATPRRALAAAGASGKSTQERLSDEHQKAKDRGYDKEFHDAIKNNGGERLKEEWKKNCRSRVMKDAKRSADLAETNCY